MIQCCIGFLFLLFHATFALQQERPIIQTSLGTIKGYYKHTRGGHQFSAYEGIPYAKPPIGNLRFEEPTEIEPWSGIWDATTLHTCLQLSYHDHQALGDEDCLYLNVYVPQNNNSNLDVIVHIHGGAFMLGDTSFSDSQHLIERNVIFVSMTYRLGALGFLSTQDDIVPGNNGMKDQVMALRWVQDHIERFGGNPDSVTITGVSAGAASVHLHYFSPLSKGLFHKGISHGGTALAPWVVHKAPLRETKKLAISIGCDIPSTKELVKCLKSRSARQIVENSYHSPIAGFPLAPFAPVVERRSTNAFLTDYPYKLLKSGSFTDAPWLTGSTTEEGILGLMLLNFKFDEINKDWNKVLPYVFNYENSITESEQAVITQKIKKIYFNNQEISDDSSKLFIELFGERYFLLDLEKSVRLQVELAKSPVYTYIYGYKLKAKLDSSFQMPRDYGVYHGADALLPYEGKYFGSPIIKDELSESDNKIKQFLLDTITSFAKNGKPASMVLHGSQQLILMTWDIYLFITKK